MGPAEIALALGVLLIALWVAYRVYMSNMLQNEGFANTVTSSTHSFVMYYADWCGHCKRAKPEFSKLGSTLTIGEKSVKMVAINSDENPEVVKAKNIRGYPTIHLYDPKGNLLQEYSGERTQPAFEEFLNQYMN
jgi:thiol-disulfide isomerase/thioredoxin